MKAFAREFIPLMCIVALSMLTACSAPTRTAAVPASEEEDAITVDGMKGIRYWGDETTPEMIRDAKDAFDREVAARKAAGEHGSLPPAIYLAISGGGENGAFGAGLLVGWTAHGDRPSFKAVTGVSTGALIAPFAFLGPAYDEQLKTVYTTISGKDILEKRSFLAAIWNDAMADNAPLKQTVARFVDQKLLDAIAAEYAKGRLLLIGTTDLDTLEPVIWNMTAIAASKDPRAIELFRKVLLASAAIPGAFPPVLIDVEVDGKHYQEMHVDGGAMTQVFAYPPTIRATDIHAERQRVLYIIRNARLDVDWASTRRRTIPIAMRAVGGLMQVQGIGDLYRIFLTTQRDGVDYNLASIPSTFTTPHPKDFDQAYMRALYQTGYDMAVRGYPWQKDPPGYSSPFTQQAEAPKPVASAGAGP